MPSTYTGNNTLTLQAFNENPNSWGSILNTVFELVDSSLDGIEAVDVAGSAPTATLTIADGASAQARSRVLNFTGARTVTNITVTIGPNTAEKIYWVRNSTTGGFSVILAQGSGSTVTIAPGAWALVFLDGAGSGAGVTTLTSFAMAGSSSGITILQPSAVASGTLTLPAATDTLVGRATTDTLSNKTLTAPILGTPASGTLSNCTGLPIATGVSGLATGVATFLATPTSANLAAALTDETGTGASVFATSPTLATPTITTNATVPIVIGGTGTTSTLSLRSTSGVGTTGADIVFQTGNNGSTEVMRLQNGGNVGVGTPSPSWQTQIYGTGQNTAALTDAGSSSASLFVGSSNGATGAGGAVLLGGIVANGVTSHWAIKSLITSTTANGTGDLAFATRAATGDTSLTERMRLLAGGNVAIGSSAAARKLTVYEGAAGTGDVGVRVEHVSSKPAYVELVTSQRAALFGLGAYSGSGFTGAMQLVCDGGFHVCPSGTGAFAVGLTNPSYQLQLSTDSAAKPSTNTWTIASDARLKTVLGDYEKGLDAICALRPVRYEYNGSGGMRADGKEHVSIIAQEAAEAFPECIGTFQGKLHEDDEEETELLNYNGHAITFALINAVRELKARLDALA